MATLMEAYQSLERKKNIQKKLKRLKNDIQMNFGVEPYPPVEEGEEIINVTKDTSTSIQLDHRPKEETLTINNGDFTSFTVDYPNMIINISDTSTLDATVEIEYERSFTDHLSEESFGHYNTILNEVEGQISHLQEQIDSLEASTIQ